MTQDSIQFDDFEKILNNFAALKAINLVGEGEPLLHKDFFEMARLARDRDIKVMTISNGSAFSKSVVRKLCHTEVRYVSVSIDSADPEIFAQSRIGGKLNRIWDGINRLHDYREKKRFKYPKIGVTGTLFSHTVNRALNIVTNAKQHGVDIFDSFQSLNTMATYLPRYPISMKQELEEAENVRRLIPSIEERAKNILKPIAEFCAEEGIPFSKIGRKNHLRRNCDEEWIYSLVSGDVTPCCQIKTPINHEWNLTRNSIAEIQSDQAYETLRFNLWNGIFPKYCSGCWKTRAL
jgi:MoaA/NifB/PqqE/SkfB family radical SAM enzyme